MTAVIILVILAAGTGWLLWSHLKKVAAEDLERSYMNRAIGGMRNPDQMDLDRASDEGMVHPDDGIR